jgi:hypothetical protein
MRNLLNNAHINGLSGGYTPGTTRGKQGGIWYFITPPGQPEGNKGEFGILLHPRDNQGETRGNLVFYLCILPVNPGEITNLAIIG